MRFVTFNLTSLAIDCLLLIYININELILKTADVGDESYTLFAILPQFKLP